MPTFDAEVGHGDESGAVPTRPVDDTVHGAVRNRGEVPPGAVSLALAEGVSLSGVRRSVVFAIPARGAVVLSVSGVPVSNDAAERHRVRGNQAAADDLVPRDPPADFDQDQHGRTGTEAALGGELPHRVAPEAQGDGGDDAARRTAPAQRFRADRRRVPGR